MSGQTVLIVEDDPHLRRLGLDLFESAGLRAEGVGTADQALRFVWERWDCTAFVLTDVQAPGTINGLGLARLVRTHWPRIEVVVTSGQPVPNTMLPTGVQFAAKPWSPDDLLVLAQDAVAKVH